ncbi:predicted protein [Uncinocarpus reesii 1704]|uniref:Uncharacterized protein n=1 Tax=Uncinocarpus reesii (strain UAMH 1704) TaxID=336963 RepID=C4JUS1_UNCRE|nr:uncharacterized protein UREG_04874 [Uncinocarpus reesii 1704]EEP80032.1 predicted protein [Uncinocarpus reesii 1704]
MSAKDTKTSSEENTTSRTSNSRSRTETGTNTNTGTMTGSGTTTTILSCSGSSGCPTSIPTLLPVKERDMLYAERAIFSSPATTTSRSCSDSSGCPASVPTLPPVIEPDMLYAEPSMLSTSGRAKTTTTKDTPTSTKKTTTTTNTKSATTTTFKKQATTLSSQTKTAAGTHSPAAPAVLQKCHGLKTRKYVTRDTVKDLISSFCRAAVKQGKLDKNSGAISRTYLKGTMEEVEIAIDWAPKLDFKPTLKDCERNLIDRALDGCDGNDPNNPMNWKGGGRVTVGPVTYRIDPRTKRHPAPKKVLGTAYPRWNEREFLFRVWGRGWLNSDFGVALQREVKKKCGRTPSEFKFEYRLEDDGSEWSIDVNTGVRDAHCLLEAAKSAGGPKDFAFHRTLPEARS